MIKNKFKKFRKLKKLDTRKVILWISIMLVFSLSLGTMVRFYAAGEVNQEELSSSGIQGTTVIVDDKSSDWNYYTSLNYTEVRNPASRENLPGYEENYNENKLVYVQINYSGEDINSNGGPRVGQVSDSEPQDTYVYYKYYPIKGTPGNEYVEIELIDNPWGKRPTGYGFNNWVCDENATVPSESQAYVVNCNNLEFSYDNQYYTRTVKVPASSSIANEKKIINLKTSWILADIKYNTSDLADLNEKKLVSVNDNSSIAENITTPGYNLTGYFYKVTSGVSNPNNGLYYDENGDKCTSCSLPVYKLIQNSDTAYKTGGPSLNPNNYYYLVTRDTNIFEVGADNINLSTFVVGKPLTITSSHDGSSSQKTITASAITTDADMTIENVILQTTSMVTSENANHIPADLDSPYKSIFAENNLKLGRNIGRDTAGNNYSLDDIISGLNVKVIVESGYYHDLVGTPGNRNTVGIKNYNIYGNDYDRVDDNDDNLIIHYAAVGATNYTHDNDLDAVSITTVKSGFFGKGAIGRATDTKVYQYGIYAGTIRGTTTNEHNDMTSALRILKVEGGKIANINGGPDVKTDLKDVTVAIYITGGEIENAVSGAGTARSYGARIMSVSGGQINNVVAGGSNSYYPEANSGPLSADTLVYIGGNAKIGTDNHLLDINTNMYGVINRGSVFGAGLGREGYDNLGIVDNTTVIIDGNAKIRGDVYGGGNYGAVGTNTIRPSTDIMINGGEITGSVFGGSNNNGFSSTASVGTINIEVNGGETGSIYGGSNVEGLVNGDVDILLKGGTINGAVYGGGYGVETQTNGFINVKTNDPDNQRLVINSDSNGGSIYGGSANGSINELGEVEGEDPATIPALYKSGTPMEYNKYFKNIKYLADDDYVYVGSGYRRYGTYKSNTTYGKCSLNDGCPTYIKMPDGATFENGLLNPEETYFKPTYTGANITGFTQVTLKSGSNRGNSRVEIRGGVINGGVFGGGYGDVQAPLETNTIGVDVYSGIINEVYAGDNVRGNLTQDLNQFYVTIHGGTINNVFGGSKGPDATVDYTEVLVTGGTITGGVYGGGYQATTTSSNVVVEGGTFYAYDSNEELLFGGAVYGGGYSAAVPTTNVLIKDSANAYDVFGGSNVSGVVANALVNINSGTVAGSAYGGGRKAPVTNTIINLNGGNITNAFAGGAEADVTDKSVLTLNAGTVTNVFGGSDLDGTVNDSYVQLLNGTVTNAFGGNNAGGITNKVLLDIEPSEAGTLTVTNIFGGSKGVGATSKYSDVRIKGRIVDDVNKLTVENIYGGGYEAVTNTYTNLYIQDVTANDIFGGGFRGKVYGTTNVNIIDNVKATNVYGGGFYAFVGYSNSDSNGEYAEGDVEGSYSPSPGATYVNIINANITKNVYGSGNASFVYGDTHVNIGDNAIARLVEQTSEDNPNAKAYEKAFAPAVESAQEHLKITIGGNIFGGSETNAVETTLFDYNVKGVVGTAKVSISAENYYSDNNGDGIDDLNITFRNSVYGQGNNSNVDGSSYVLLNKVGTDEKELDIVSIQRATYTYIVDSYIFVQGMRDRALGTATPYSLIRLDNLYLLGNSDNAQTKGSTIYLGKSTTDLNAYYSGAAQINATKDGLVDNSFVKEEVTQTIISEENQISNITPTTSVDNRIYISESTTTNTFAVISGEVPKVEKDTANGGPVTGMTFFGVYYYDAESQKLKKSIYDYEYNADDIYPGISGVHESAFAQVFGRHDQDFAEQKTTNGFYTHYLREDTRKISVDYIDPSPLNATYYRWSVGDDILKIIVPMEANKYSQKTAVNAGVNLAELMEDLGDGTRGYWSNAKLKIVGVNIDGFHTDDLRYSGTLVDKSTIPTLNIRDDNGDGVVDANNNFALSMGTTSSGWLDNYKTDFYSNNRAPAGIINICTSENSQKCSGSSEYVFDSSHDLRNLSFWLYYSENLDLTGAVKNIVGDEDDEEETDDTDISSISMGSILIQAEIQKYNSDLTYAGETRQVNIYVTITLTDGESDSYGAMKSAGKKYDVFQDGNVSISADGSFSIYQKLTLDLSKNVAAFKDPTPWDVGDLYNGEIIEKTVKVSGIDTTQYWGPSYRYLASDYLFPEGTRITMIDLITNEEYFYTLDYSLNMPTFENGIYKYFLTDFAKMGSTKIYNEDHTKIESEFYSDDMRIPVPGHPGEYDWEGKYYNEEANYATEEFIFIFDLGGTEDYQIGQSNESHYVYLTLARQVASSLDGGNLVSPNESNVISPRGDPSKNMNFTLNPKINSVIDTTGIFYDTLTGQEKEEISVYDDSQNMSVKLKTILKQTLDETNALGIIDTQYEDYRVGAKITIQRQAKDQNNNAILDGDNNPVYEDVTEELNGLTVTSRDEDYFPFTDGSIRIQLAGRITEIGSLIKFDFSKSDLNYGKYRLYIETFVSYDGLYYGTDQPDIIILDFELLDSNYGLEMSTTPEAITHDVNTGKDSEGNRSITYTIRTKNGLTNPNLKISLDRRYYTSIHEDTDPNSAIYNTNYEKINISDIFSDIVLLDSENNQISTDVFGTCLMQTVYDTVTEQDDDGNDVEVLVPREECSLVFSLGDIERSKREISANEIEDNMITYTLIATLKEGPTDEEKANPVQSGWKSGTYRVVVSMYDDARDELGTTYQTTHIGDIYEYLIIRSLDVDGEEAVTPAPSPNPSENTEEGE